MSELNLALQNLPAFSDNQTNDKISMCSVMGNNIHIIEMLLFADISCSNEMGGLFGVLSDFTKFLKLSQKCPSFVSNLTNFI